MKTMSAVFGLAFLCGSAVVARDQTPAQLALMTNGKIEADLGNYAKAAEAFRSVAEDASVPGGLRSEALVRLGLARSASGDSRGSLEAFKAVLTRYAMDRSAVRFATGALAARIPGKTWPEFRTQLEELLQTATVLSVTYAGMPQSSPRIVRLKWDDFEVRGTWDSQGGGRLGSLSGSHAAEVAAYEIDKLLGLDMVPPTVARSIEGQSGAITLWINGVRVYRDAQEMPKTSGWKQQVSRMKLYDSLIGNAGRNLMNMIVDQNDNLLLLDHELAFSSDRAIKDPPSQFDRRLVDKLKALDTPQARAQLHGILGDDEIASLLARRDALLAHLRGLIAERGEAAVMF